MVRVLSFQHKGLLNYLKENSIYECTQTRESKHKYWKLQEELGLSKDTYPVWVFKSDTSEYLGKGQICSKEDRFLKEEVQTELFSRFLFHISMCWIDTEEIRNLIDKCYLYEFEVAEEDLYKDLLEGYTLCKVMKNVKASQLVEVYEMSELEEHLTILSKLSYFKDYSEDEMREAHERGVFLLNLEPLIKTRNINNVLSDKSFIVGTGDFVISKNDLNVINKDKSS